MSYNDYNDRYRRPSDRNTPPHRHPGDMDFMIDPNDPIDDREGAYNPPRKTDEGSHTAIVVIFTVIFTLVIVFAVYIFCFRNGGFFRGGSDPTSALAPGTPDTEVYPFVGLALDQTSTVMTEGERLTLKVKFEKPAQSADVNTRLLKLNWKSENPAVCVVDQRGTVLARQAGTARIVVSIQNDDIDSNAAYCLITVNPSNRYEGYEAHPVDEVDPDEYYSSPSNNENAGKPAAASRPADIPGSVDASATVSHSPGDYAAGKRSVFGGRATFDHMTNTITMTGTMTFTSHDADNHTITMRAGDRIRNAVVSRDGYLIQGQFVSGGRTTFVYALREKL